MLYLLYLINKVIIYVFIDIIYFSFVIVVLIIGHLFLEKLTITTQSLKKVSSGNFVDFFFFFTEKA